MNRTRNANYKLQNIRNKKKSNIFNKHSHLTFGWHRNLHRRLLAINWVYYELSAEAPRALKEIYLTCYKAEEDRNESNRSNPTKWVRKSNGDRCSEMEIEDFWAGWRGNWATVRIKAKCHNSQINQSQLTTRDSRNCEHRSKRTRRPAVCVDDLTKMSKK